MPGHAGRFGCGRRLTSRAGRVACVSRPKPPSVREPGRRRGQRVVVGHDRFGASWGAWDTPPRVALRTDAPEEVDGHPTSRLSVRLLRQVPGGRAAADRGAAANLATSWWLSRPFGDSVLTRPACGEARREMPGVREQPASSEAFFIPCSRHPVPLHQIPGRPRIIWRGVGPQGVSIGNAYVQVGNQLLASEAAAGRSA